MTASLPLMSYKMNLTPLEACYMRGIQEMSINDAFSVIVTTLAKNGDTIEGIVTFESNPYAEHIRVLPGHSVCLKINDQLVIVRALDTFKDPPDARTKIRFAVYDTHFYTFILSGKDIEVAKRLMRLVPGVTGLVNLDGYSYVKYL